MPASHGKQKQLEKQKKRRELARRKAKAATLALSPPLTELLRRAAHLPHGPTFISAGWEESGGPLPALVTVIITRVIAKGLLFTVIVLVDRTCLGVKNAFAAKPVLELDLERWLEHLAELYGGIEPCELLVGQSVIYHAIDYARSLGFLPHPDFHEPAIGPRPAQLLDTPYARLPRPYYVSGPDDDVEAILMQLDRAAGRGNYDFMIAEEQVPEWLVEEIQAQG